MPIKQVNALRAGGIPAANEWEALSWSCHSHPATGSKGTPKSGTLNTCIQLSLITLNFMWLVEKRLLHVYVKCLCQEMRLIFFLNNSWRKKSNHIAARIYGNVFQAVFPSSVRQLSDAHSCSEYHFKPQQKWWSLKAEGFFFFFW